MSGHRGYEFLEFLGWNLFPFLPDIGFHLLKSSWSSLTYFSFNDAPNVLYRWKIWTAGRQFSTQTLLLRIHAVKIAAVSGFAWSCWNILKYWVFNKGLQPCPLRRYFSSFSETFDDELMHYRWRDLQSLCKLMLMNIVSKYSNLLHTLSQIREPLPIFTSERFCLSKTSLS